jgi:hypothetical protein
MLAPPTADLALPQNRRAPVYYLQLVNPADQGSRLRAQHYKADYERNCDFEGQYPNHHVLLPVPVNKEKTV